VSALVHDIRLNSATTTVTLAVSQGSGGTDDGIAVPAAPTVTPIPDAPRSVVVQNKIGGDDTVPDWDPAWEEESTFSSNHSSITTVDENKIYPFRVSVKGPDVTEENRAEATGTTETTVLVSVPADPYTLEG
jgi:hypothetical protein